MRVSLPSSLQTGFTLIEVLIGIALGVVVLGAIIAFFVPTLMTWQTTTAQAYMQDTEQILEDIFHRAIRPAKAIGCGQASIQNGVTGLAATDTAWATQFSTPLRGIAQDANVDDLLETSGSIESARLQDSANTPVGDVLVALVPDGSHFRSAGACTQPITAAGNSPCTLPLSAGATITNGGFYFIHDCDAPTVVRADTAAINTAIPTPRLGFMAPNTIIDALTSPSLANTVISGYHTKILFLDTSNNIPTLSERSITRNGNLGAATPLVSGVINMRFYYQPNDSNTWQSINAASSNAGIVNNLDNYRAIKVAFLIESPQVVNSRRLQPSLFFPDNLPTDSDCFGTANTPANDCPTGLIQPNKMYKVISFIYDFPV